MGHQPFIGRSRVVGEGANYFFIVIAVSREAVGYHHRPIGQIGEEDIRRICDVVVLLCAGSTAQRDVSVAADGVSSDVLLRLQQYDGSSVLASLNGGGEADGAGPDHHDIRLSIPLDAFGSRVSLWN